MKVRRWPRRRTLWGVVQCFGFVVLIASARSSAAFVSQQDRALSVPCCRRRRRRYLAIRNYPRQTSYLRRPSGFQQRPSVVLPASPIPIVKSLSGSLSTVANGCQNVCAPALALTASTLIGYFIGNSHIGSGVGILATLVVASWMASVPGVPQSHFLYDQAWSTLLPASLVLLLWSLPRPSVAGAEPSQTGNTKDASPLLAIRRVGLPFGLATLGSILGCYGAFDVTRRLRQTLSSSPLIDKLLLETSSAAFAAACLAASFVGGSVNFFATANALQTSGTNTGTAMTVITSMAAADLVVMAVYFAGLGFLLQFKHLKIWFDGQDSIEGETEPDEPTRGSAKEPISSTEVTWGWKRRLRAIGIGSTFALSVVRFSRFAEHLIESIIPGTTCAVIAGTVPLVKSWMFSPGESGTWKHDTVRIAEPLSQLCFYSLFASIGMTADIATAVRDGPACLLFSLLALAVHMLVTLVGSWIVRTYFRRDRQSIQLEDVLVASNAAIGGPATAAAFCGQIRGDSRTNGLAVAATVWGVVGYAVGTTVGVLLYRCLVAFL